MTDNSEAPDSARSDDKGAAPLQLDTERYRAYLESLDLTREQEEEVLTVLWQIAATFARIGWGMDSLQAIFAKAIENAMAEGECTVEKNNNQESFNGAAQAPEGKGWDHD